MRFSLKFSGPIHQGVGHVYISALPHTPPCALRDQYQHEIKLPFVIKSALSHWDSCICIIDPQTSQVGPVAFSPDGHFIVSGSEDGIINVWNATNGAEVSTICASGGAVKSVDFSYDGSRFCSGSEDGTIGIWDTTTGVSLKCFQKYEQVASVLFSSDDVHVVSGDGCGSVCVWDSINGSLQWCRDEAKSGYVVAAIAISPKGLLMASSINDTIELWQLSSGKSEARLCGFIEFISNIAFLPNGQQLVAAGDDKLVVWDVTHHCVIKAVDVGHLMMAFTMSPNGTHFASADGLAIVIQDLETLQHINRLTGHTLRILAIAFSPDSNAIVSTSSDHTLRLWDAWNASQFLMPSGNVRSGDDDDDDDGYFQVVLACNGQCVAQGHIGSNQITIWDLTSDSPAVDIYENNTIAHFSISKDGNYIITATRDGPPSSPTLKKVSLWDAVCFKSLFEEITMEPGQVDSTSDGQTVFSRNGSLFASNHVLEKREIWIWGIHTMEKICQLSDSVTAFAFSNDATQLVSIDFANEVHIWNVQSGTMVNSVHPAGLGECSIFFSPDDSLIYCVQVETCMVLSMKALQKVEEFESGLLFDFKEDEYSTVVPRSLKFENEWLWEIDHNGKRRLCWLPPECRIDFSFQAAWQGSHLAIALKDGNIAIFNVDIL